MRHHNSTPRIAIAVAGLMVSLLILAGCSSGDDDNAASGASTTTTEAATDATTTTTGADTTATTGAPTGVTTPAVEAAAPVADLAQQLNDADLGCDAVEDPRDVDGAQAAAQCTLTESPAYLYTFDDDEQRDAFIDGGGVIDCTFIFGSGISFDYVVADGVIVRPDDNADADALAAALDGEVRTISCEAPDAG